MSEEELGPGVPDLPPWVFALIVIALAFCLAAMAKAAFC